MARLRYFMVNFPDRQFPFICWNKTFCSNLFSFADLKELYLYSFMDTYASFFKIQFHQVAVTKTIPNSPPTGTATDLRAAEK